MSGSVSGREIWAALAFADPLAIPFSEASLSGSLSGSFGGLVFCFTAARALYSSGAAALLLSYPSESLATRHCLHSRLCASQCCRWHWTEQYQIILQSLHRSSLFYGQVQLAPPTFLPSPLKRPVCSPALVGGRGLQPQGGAASCWLAAVIKGVAAFICSHQGGCSR